MIRPEFDEKKALYTKNPVYLFGLMDPITVKVAKFMYNLGFSANLVTLITFTLAISSLAVLFFMRNYTGFIIAAILITLRNLGDTVDGKIARGSGTTSPVGGFSDAVSDWIIFHAFFFIILGYLTNNLAIGFLCVTGYMSREFTRRRFEASYGEKAIKTKESKKISWIISAVTKYDLANVFILAPIFLLLNQPVLLIYAVAIIEYTLLFGEMGFDFYCLLKKSKENKKAKESREEIKEKPIENSKEENSIKEPEIKETNQKIEELNKEEISKD